MDKELSHDIIAYLKNTFATIVKRNKNNKERIEEKLKNLAYHVFDIHDNCGSYCKYKIEKENYDNSRHMKNPTLFEHIRKFFLDLANNAHKFVFAGSSQANESLNNSMASFCPKSYSYSTSESADYRYACTVGHKNLGSDYILKVFQKMNLTYRKKIVYFCNYAKKKAIKRLTVASTPHFKTLRKFNSIKKEQLRNQKEKKAKDTYSSNMTFLEMSSQPENLIKQVDNYFTYNT